MSGGLAFGGGIALAGGAAIAAGGVAIAGGGVAGGSDLPGMSRMAMAGAAAGRVLDFRRRGAPPRRRRRSPLLVLARPLVVAAATVALPLALGAWLLTSRQFQLHTIAVGRRAAVAPIATVLAAKAAERVPAVWVRQALAPLLGRNLLRLPLAEVRLRLAANPWVAAAEVAKELPDRLRITVAERRPAVLLRSGDTLLYADAAGLPIAPVGPPAAVAAARRQGLLLVASRRPARRCRPRPRRPASPAPCSWRRGCASCGRRGRRRCRRSTSSTRTTTACTSRPCPARCWCAAAAWPTT